MMTHNLASLSHAELVALVQSLQQQLVEREHEVIQLREQLAQQTVLPQSSPSVVEEPPPGSHEDLLAQLEKIYPER